MDFKHELGAKVKTKVVGLVGKITLRAECLYGCNRYLIQPEVDKDSKVPESYYVDEDDIIVLEPPAEPKKERNTGGLMSRKC